MNSVRKKSILIIVSVSIIVLSFLSVRVKAQPIKIMPLGDSITLGWDCPVDYTNDLFKALKLQDDIQIKYTGGTVLHGFIGEKISSADTIKNLIKKVFSKFHLPYFTITPTFSVCPHHGYIPGEHFTCP